MWDFETIDNADISEDNSVFEMEPLTEIKVLLICVCHVICITHSYTHNYSLFHS